MSTSAKSLKKANLVFLSAMVAFDIIALLLVVVPSALEAVTLSKMIVARLSAMGFLPMLVLFASSLAPSSAKDVLVFWRFKDVLPGHRAFSVHAPSDPRIDLAKLKKNVGSFPEIPREQNAKWYGLYKQCASEVTVEDSHQNFLRYRDLAVLSLILTFFAPVVMFALRSSVGEAVAAAGIIGTQYLFAMIAARHHAYRFVTNVLAVHSTTKIRGAAQGKEKAADKAA